MKPTHAPSIAWIASLTIACSLSAQAADIFKDNNSTNLNDGASWVDDVVNDPTDDGPGSTDIAVWNNTVTSANTVSLGANLSWAGIKILNPTGAVTINAGNTLTLGTSGIDLSKATQNLTLNNGVALSTSGNQTWNVAAGRSLAANGVLSGGSSSRTLVKTGAGALTLGGVNTYTSKTALYQGTLNLDYTSGAGKRLGGAALTLGGTLNLGNGGVETVSSTTLYGDPNSDTSFGGSAATLTRAAGSSSVLQMGALTRQNSKGGTINFTAANIATTTSANDASGILGGWATVAGTNWAANDGSGNIVAFSGTYKDATAVSISSTDNLTVLTDATQSGITANSVRFNDGAARTLTLSGANTLSSGGILVTSNAGAGKIDGGSLTTATSDVVVIQNSNSDFTINSQISGSGKALTKSGAGRLILTTAASHSSGTMVNEGALRLQGVSGTSIDFLTAAGGRVYVRDGAALEFQDASVTSSNAHALTIQGMGINNGGALRNIAGNNIYGSKVTLTADTRVNADAGMLALGGVIGGSYNLITGGAGTVALSGANTYTGKTTVSEGTLKLSGSGSIAASSSIEVMPGAVLDVTSLGGFTLAANQTLEGTGTVNGNITVAGTLAPGMSPGTLTVGGDLTLGGTVNLELNGTTAGTTYDQVALHGAGVLGGTLNLAWNLLSAPGDGTELVLIDNDGSDSFTGTFSNAADGSQWIDNLGGTWNLDYTGGTGNDLTLVAAVPETSSLLLGGLGILALLRRRRH